MGPIGPPAGPWPKGVAALGGPAYLPFVARAPVDDPPHIDEKYATLIIEGNPETRPAAEHPDLNLALRGYRQVDAFGGLVDYGGEADSHPPQLVGLLGRLPVIRGTYQVYDWDWARMAPSEPIASPAVTLITLGADRNELVRVPDAGRIIDRRGYQALVLYAESSRITLKYTREDNVVEGYTLHLERVSVASELLDLYRESDRQGRKRLPALRAGQVLGWAAGETIGVAIRDCGTFMDPRSRKDWWQGF